MAKRTPRPCRYPHCHRLTTERIGYCDEHKHTGWETYQGGKSRHERGYGSHWEKVRYQRLKIDKHLCQECLRQGRAVMASDVDHIIPKEHGGTDDLSNLESLCRSCHRRKTALERIK